MTATTDTAAGTFTVTRTEQDDRYVYSVNGTEICTKTKPFGFAVVGAGNPHHPAGFWFALRSSQTAAAREAAKDSDLVAVQVTEA
jgi:hypothetical protein